MFSYPADFFSYAGEAIWESYSSLVTGSVGSLGAIGTTLVRAAPLICAGLGVTLAFRAGLFNIGAQGQLVVGSLTAGYVGFTWDLPPGVHLVAAILAGMIGGAIWGGIAGVLKARTGAHEVITTIMLNYLATSFLLNYLLSKDAFQRAGQRQRAVAAAGRLRDVPRARQHPPRRLRRGGGRDRRVVADRAQHLRLRAAGGRAPTPPPRAPPA